jgi:N-acetylglucosaminyldiphosphoundecaprenol N-acetyl-beta-D-mannosaminyltransferase
MNKRIGFFGAESPMQLADGLGPPPPTVSICGVPVARISVAEALSTIRKMLGSGRPHQIVTVNAQFLRLASGSLRLHGILQRADLVLCDSAPLRWGARFLGGKIPERIAGSDLVMPLLKACLDLGKSVLWLGGMPADSEAVKNKIRQELPELRFEAWTAPEFPLGPESLAIAKSIVAQSKPDLLLVSWGCPFAEEWIDEHARGLGVPVAVGVGAAVAFISGRLRRAPPFLQRWGLEWVFRMAQEPTRLGRRYFRDALTVPVAIFAQRLGWGRKSSREQRSPTRNDEAKGPPDALVRRGGS